VVYSQGATAYTGLSQVGSFGTFSRFNGGAVGAAWALDGVFANVDKNTPKLRENLEAHEAQVRQNAQATPLIRDVPLDVSLDDLRVGQWDAEEVRNLFTFLEFRTLWDRLLEAVGGPPAAEAGPAESLDVDLERLATAEDAVATLQRLAGSTDAVAVGAAWDGIEGRSPLLALAFASGNAPTAAQFLTADLLTDQKVVGALAALVSDGGPPVEAHRAKELMRALEPLGVDIRSLDLDTAVGAYLVDPGESDYLLEDLTVRYLGVELRSADSTPAGQLDLDGMVTQTLALDDIDRAFADLEAGNVIRSVILF